jgi:prepilin-type N-terminal cleavage/methylation domain-containing protein
MDQTRLRTVTGYSVIELLFVMVVLGILLTITYLKAEPALERARVRGAAGIMATDLQYAQALAARFRTPMVVSVNVTQKTYQIADRAGTNVYRLRNLGGSGEYALDEFTAAPAAVEVFPNAVVAQSATYTLGLNGYRRQVTFSRAGQVRVVTVP